MQTSLADFIKDTPQGREADSILRTCVHCGFCTATCPTYQLLGDELDGPRGRIYLIKQLLETGQASAKTRLHLDRCLTCRACETTCPSGVRYGHLLDIGRGLVSERVGRPRAQVLMRRGLAAVLSRRSLFAPLLAIGRLARPLLPGALAKKIPAKSAASEAWPQPRHARKMLALAGCVQSALGPGINAAAARVLDRLGISLIEARGAGCCGALRYHLDFQVQGLGDMRRLIDAWWPAIEQGAEAIVITASGCGAMVKDYGHALAHDPAYAEKAAWVSALAKDISEVVAAELETLVRVIEERSGSKDAPLTPAPRIAFHPPCTLQHGQKIRGVTERVLGAAGFELANVPDAHLCCGSAGTYSILQPELSRQLKRAKLAALASGLPEMIVSSNIACQAHLASEAEVPVKHWIEALDERLAQQPAPRW
ncbi:MAG: glycolate oxidase subunit GlcF [Betaproteobacteria bacterium]|nr:glycolate oxidase subunit GlcF [Betaproteobacteria bacterium]